MTTRIWRLPQARPLALTITRRNFLVWRKLLRPALLFNIGEPLIYLLGMGYGLGMFIGEIADMPYLLFLTSGIVASTAMNLASFEGMYSVFTRMVPQRTYDAILATPLEVDDIITGEMIWCALKGTISASAILLVGAALGVIKEWSALFAVPIVFLTGLCFAGPAIIMSAFARSYDFFNYYFVLAVTPMLILSGIFYPVSSLPTTVQTVVQMLPLTHAVALARPLVAGQASTDVLLHLSVLLGYILVGYYFALVCVRRRLNA